jgi:hypothetical protein
MVTIDLIAGCSLHQQGNEEERKLHGEFSLSTVAVFYDLSQKELRLKILATGSTAHLLEKPY